MFNKRIWFNGLTATALVLGAFVTPKLAPAAPAAEWSAWAHTLSVDVHNNASAALPAAYTVNFVLDTASLVGLGQMQADCDDLRVSYDDGATDTELDRLITGCNTSATTVTFRTQTSIIANGVDGRYRLHYANPAATNPPADRRNVYAFFEDFQDGDAVSWNQKGNWAVIDDGGNFIYRYTGSGATWALASVNLAGLSDLDYVAKLRATDSPMTNWIGLAFRIQDQNNFLTFYESRDSNQLKYARIIADNHTIVLNPAASMAADTWYWMRVQAIGNQVRARLWADGSAEPASWLINTTDTTFQTASNLGLTLYNHTTNADWDDITVRRLVAAEPAVVVHAETAPWWDNAWAYRARLTVDNPSATETARSRYSMRVALDTAALIASGQMLDGCQDLRVVSFDGISNIELDRAVSGCNSANTEVWFALPRALGPGGQDAGYHLYYGNPTAGSPPANANNVFVFREDWEQGAGHWTNAGGLDPANTGTMGQTTVTDIDAVSPSHSQVFPEKRGGGDAFSGYIPVSPGTSYAIGVWGKSATTAWAPVGFDPYDTAYNRGGEVWLWTNEWSIGPEWSYRSARFTTAGNVAYLKIKSEWWVEGPGTTPVYMDDLVLRYANAVEPGVTLGDEESTLPAPVIGEIDDTGPVEIGNPIEVIAAVSATEGAITSVTLRVTAPESADVPMTLVSGDTLNGTWQAAFTPHQGSAYTYRILARAGSRSRLSPAHTFTAIDTAPPQISLVSVIAPILIKNTQTLTVTVTDNGRISNVRLTVPGATYSMTQHGDQYAYSWPVTMAGTIAYTVVATDTAGNHASLAGSFVSQPREIDVCTWQSCKPGAASWSNDDSNSNCKAELETAGFRGTYYVNGSSPQTWYTNYSAAGHEIGAHTVSHPCDGACCGSMSGGTCTPENIWQCPYTITDVVSYRETQFEPNIDSIEAATGKPVLSGAWPCGCADPRRMIAASSYFLGVRGYNDCGCAWVQDNNEPTPIMFMNLNGLHAYEQSYIDRAIAEGKWTAVTSHGSCDGISYMGSRRDVLWTAPVGEVLKYIKVRDAAQFSNYARSGRTITFDAVHTLTAFQRQKLDGTFFLPVAFDNPVTLKAHVLDTDNVLGVQVNGAPISFTVQVVDGARFVLFDTALDTLKHVTIHLSAPAPTIETVADNGPVEMGSDAHITARVTIDEGAVQTVTLRVVSPQPADYAMSLVAGATDSYAASFTPSAIGAYAYRVIAANDEGASNQSELRSLMVRDTTPPLWRAQSQSASTLPPGQTNTLSIEGYDPGGLQRLILATDESNAWHEFDWPVSDWWDYRWAHRRPIIVNETAGMARAAETLDIAISSSEFPGLTDCARELRVADTNRVETPSQVYGQQNDGGVLTCHLLFQATVGANASRTYYLYYGNPAATPPTYSTDLTHTDTAGLLTVHSAFFDVDLDKVGGVISRVRLPGGSNTPLPLSNQSNAYWGWHQVCSSLDGNITGKNMQCANGAGVPPASGLTLSTAQDGPLSKAFVFTSVKGAATYIVTYRFFAGAPYYEYRLERAGTTATVMNNFWYANGNAAPLGDGVTTAPATVYNSYALGADHIRIASFAPVDHMLIDGGDNDGTQLGASDYRYPTAPGLSLIVATGSSQQAAQDVIAHVASPVSSQLGAPEDAPQGQYGSPFDALGATGWTPATFAWQNGAIAEGATVHWRAKLCDLSANCATSDEMTFRVGQSTPPPPLPSSFYGEIHVLDNPPGSTDTVEAQVSGIVQPFSVAIESQAGELVYRINVPGDIAGTLAKEGGAEGDTITFTIGQRTMAVGAWRSGANTRLDFHPPQVVLNLTTPANEGTPFTVSAAGSDDWGHDISAYEFDCDADGVYESGAQTIPTTQCMFADDGVYTIAARAQDELSGVGSGALAVTVADVPPLDVSTGGPYTTTAGQSILLTGSGTCAPNDGCAYAWVVDGQTYPGLTVSIRWLAAGTYAATFRVTDNDDNVIERTTSVLVLPAAHTIALAAGWNLVSFDVIPADTNVAAVLSSIDGHYDLVYAWDNAQQHWLKFDANAPPYSNNLNRLDHTAGFWIRLATAQTLVVAGDVPATTNIPIYPGWNLVGFPSATAQDLPGVLSDHGVGTDFTLVYAYHAANTQDPWKLFDRSSGFPGDLSALSAGWGYWIRVWTGEHTWTVTSSAP